MTGADIYLLAKLLGLAVVVRVTPERAWPQLCRCFARLELCINREKTRARVARIRATLAGRSTGLSAEEIEVGCVAAHYRWRLEIFADGRFRGWRPSIELHGKENLDAALKNGKGAIIWVGNFASSALVTKKALHKAGYAIGHLSRPTHGFARSDFALRHLNPYRQRIETQYLEDRLVVSNDDAVTGLRRLRKRLQQNKIVSITVGEWGKKAELVPVFSAMLNFATGPITMAARSHAPLLPIFTVRDEHGTYHVHIGAPLDLAGGAGKDATFECALQDYIGRLEPFVLANPTEWRAWRRMKVEPSGLAAAAKHPGTTAAAPGQEEAAPVAEARTFFGGD